MLYSWRFVSALLGAACFAGFFGALLGVGGGVFIVPIMVLMFHLPVKIAIAASIVSVIATSNAGGSSYVDQRITNLHLAMFLEIATTIGALSGSLLALYLKEWVMLIIFAVMLAYMAYTAFITRNVDDHRIASGNYTDVKQDRLSAYLNLRGDYYDEAAQKTVTYTITQAPHRGRNFLFSRACLGTSRRRWGRLKSVGHEPLYERSDESRGRNEQTHDRSYCGGEFHSFFHGGPHSFLCRRSHRHWNHLGSDRGNHGHEPPSQRNP